MRMSALLFSSLLLFAGSVPAEEAAPDKGTLNVLCGVEIEWCNLMATTFQKTSGIKVNMMRKSSGEVLAQLAAEKANPKTDVWFGGGGDTQVQAADQDLITAY